MNDCVRVNAFMLTFFFQGTLTSQSLFTFVSLSQLF